MKKLLIWILSVILLFSLAISVNADEPEQATDISSGTTFSGTGYASFSFLIDKDDLSYRRSNGNAAITLENPAGIGSLYLIFDYEYGEYAIRDNNSEKVISAGTYGFLHEFADLESGFGYAPTSITVDFANGGVQLSEIYVFSTGETPSFVQKWEPPLDGKADILVMPTHGDDDQLFFAGLFPYYAGELDCAVQVAYLTDHRCYTNVRIHEIINGLWVSGVENYPVFASRLDFMTPGNGLKDAYDLYAKYGISKDQLIGFAVEQFRRFKPQVVVGHDINGEYGHAMHKVYADIIMKGIEISNNPESYPESAQKYGLWDVPKTYLHLLEDNPIALNYDIALDHFNGLTAFQVTQKYGLPCHVSQKYYSTFSLWYTDLEGELTKATDIKVYSPCKFGLYRSTIGPDVKKNDFLENIITYEEQIRLEQERLEQERLEQERLEQERLEQERLEQERLEKERLEQERLEKERLEKERLEKERLEKQRQEQLAAEAKRVRLMTAVSVSGILVTLLIIILIFRKQSKKKRPGKYAKKF